jgi:AmiR/NasT family two-component response regulator
VAHEGEERRAENLSAAPITRELIGQAQGILIERERAIADQAFAVLRQASQHLNLKLRDPISDRLRPSGRVVVHELGLDSQP